MENHAKIQKVTGLEPLVAGGDGKAEHSLNENAQGFELTPSFTKNSVKIGFYSLACLTFIIALYLLIFNSVTDSLLLAGFGVGAIIVAKRNKGSLTAHFNSHKQEIILQNGATLTQIAYPDVASIEVIHKLRSVGNGHISATNELNIALRNGRKHHLTTGDETTVLSQAEAIASDIGVTIKHDDEAVFR